LNIEADRTILHSIFVLQMSYGCAFYQTLIEAAEVRFANK